MVLRAGVVSVWCHAPGIILHDKEDLKQAACASGGELALLRALPAFRGAAALRWLATDPDARVWLHYDLWSHLHDLHAERTALEASHKASLAVLQADIEDTEAKLLEVGLIARVAEGQLTITPEGT